MIMSEAEKEFIPITLKATVGHSVAIRCHPGTEENVQWVYYNESLSVIDQTVANDGRVLNEFAHYYELNSSGKLNTTLVIKQCNLQDTGKYGCLEQSGNGKLHTSCLCVSAAEGR